MNEVPVATRYSGSQRISKYPQHTRELDPLCFNKIMTVSIFHETYWILTTDRISRINSYYKTSYKRNITIKVNMKDTKKTNHCLNYSTVIIQNFIKYL